MGANMELVQLLQLIHIFLRAAKLLSLAESCQWNFPNPKSGRLKDDTMERSAPSSVLGVVKIR